MTIEHDRMVRRTGITAREAVAIAGLNTYATLDEIFDAKVNDKALPLQVFDADRFEAARSYYQRYSLLRVVTTPVVRHPVMRFALSDPGFAGVRSEGDNTIDIADLLVRFVSSTKNASWGPNGSQIVPPDIYAECQWNMAVCGKDLTDIVVSFVGAGFGIYPVTFSRGIFEGYYSLAEHFMVNYALPNVRPPTAAQIAASYQLPVPGAAE